MKRLLTIIALALIVSLANAQNSVTFVVDENLEPLNDKYFMEHLQKSGSEAVNGIFHDEGVPGDTQATIAWSFSNDEKFFTFTGKDPFFKTIVCAYAEHRPPFWTAMSTPKTGSGPAPITRNSGTWTVRVSRNDQTACFPAFFRTAGRIPVSAGRRCGPGLCVSCHDL